MAKKISGGARSYSVKASGDCRWKTRALYVEIGTGESIRSGVCEVPCFTVRRRGC